MTLYKGDYHGEAFHADGAYIQGPDGWVHYNEEESHIPETGERILFFGNYSEVNGEKFINPPAIGQSIFVYDNDSLSITFSYDRNPLLLELQENYGAEIVYDERSVATAVCNAEKLETALQFFSSSSYETTGIHEMWMLSDFDHMPATMQELYNESDFVATIQVTASEGKFYDESDMIYTEFQGDVTTVYKGEYNGETFRSDGGYVTLSDYAQQIITYGSRGVTMNAFKRLYTEEQLQNDWVFLNDEDSHAPQEGETILLFGKYDGQCIRSMYPGRSVYLCDGDTVSITFRNQWEEICEDLQKNYNAEVTYSETRSTAAAVVPLRQLEDLLNS